jgi:hypothetical protein
MMKIYYLSDTQSHNLWYQKETFKYEIVIEDLITKKNVCVKKHFFVINFP